MNEEQQVAVATQSVSSLLPANPTGEALGFECMTGDDLVFAKISLVQPSSHTTIEAGNWYDINSEESYGKELNFFVLSKRNSSFMAKDLNTGEDKMIEKKELLVVGEDMLPYLISLSATGYWPMSNLLSRLYKAYGINKMPIYTGLVKATSTLEINDKGKYYVPKFEAIRHANDNEMVKLTELYRQLVPAFTSGHEGEESSKIEKFAAPTEADVIYDKQEISMEINGETMTIQKEEPQPGDPIAEALGMFDNKENENTNSTLKDFVPTQEQ